MGRLTIHEIEKTASELMYYKDKLANGIFGDRIGCFDKAMEALKELQKYKDLEDIIGTTVWLCYKAWDGKIIFGEGKVVLALLDKDGIILQVERRTGKYTRTHYNYGLNEFGREMYRTKEEAEKKLQELKGNE